VDDTIRAALDHGQLIEMTTTGRRTGLARRIEIALHSFGHHLYISGLPSRRKRAWIANLEADPGLTIHLKSRVHADLEATARIITDEVERRRILALVARVWRRSDIDVMVDWSPLIEVTVAGYGASDAA
jgi:deazaflavin-dependent oxidoreductase (nitroreductase family)